MIEGGALSFRQEKKSLYIIYEEVIGITPMSGISIFTSGGVSRIVVSKVLSSTAVTEEISSFSIAISVCKSMVIAT